MITILQVKKHSKEIAGPGLTTWLIANLWPNPVLLMLKPRLHLFSHIMGKGGDEHGSTSRRGQ